MAQVICTSPKAKMQRQLGGVVFFPSPVGLISEEISDEKVEEFCRDGQFVRHFGDVIEPPKGTVKKAAPAASDAQSGTGTEKSAAATGGLGQPEF